LAFPVGIPPSVLWLILLSARIFCGYRGVLLMQIFAKRKSIVAASRKFAKTGQRLVCLQTHNHSINRTSKNLRFLFAGYVKR
jgi:hypothetical protein